MQRGSTIADVDLTGDDVVLTRIDSTHIQRSAPRASCATISFSVSGSTATAAAEPDLHDRRPGPINAAAVNITGWTLTLSGNTIATSMNGTAAVSVISCTPTSSGTLSRNATDAGAAG